MHSGGLKDYQIDNLWSAHIGNVPVREHYVCVHEVVWVASPAIGGLR